MKNVLKARDLKQVAEAFQAELPHTKKPYSSRAWGHGLHSLCSYQGKLKPSLAHWMIEEFTTADSTVLDPLGGVGTVPFEAGLLGRENYCTDLSPFAATVASAKVAPPKLDAVLSEIDAFEDELTGLELSEDDWSDADFGLNAKVQDYYHRDTLAEVLKARRILTGIPKSSERQFLKACILHILHGNRPYALSRTSHPITPFSPTGPTEYRALIPSLRKRCRRLLELELPSQFKHGSAWHSDFRQLPTLMPKMADAIICSPPFPGLRFDRPNWLRMWFSGWKGSDFHETSKGFLERQQGSSFSIYRDFFEVCCQVTNKGSPIVLHVGGSKGYDMATKLNAIAAEFVRPIATINEDVAHVEKHGIRDKGLTSSHILLVYETF